MMPQNPNQIGQDFTPDLIRWFETGYSLEDMVRSGSVTAPEANLIDNMIQQFNARGYIQQELYDDLLNSGVDPDQFYSAFYSQPPQHKSQVPKLELVFLLGLALASPILYYLYLQNTGTPSTPVPTHVPTLVPTNVPLGCGTLEQLGVTDGAMTFGQLLDYIERLPDPPNTATLGEKVYDILLNHVLPGSEQATLAKEYWQQQLASGKPLDQVQNEITQNLLSLPVSWYLENQEIQESVCNIDQNIMLPGIILASRYTTLFRNLWRAAIVEPAKDIAREYVNIFSAPINYMRKWSA